MTESTQQGQLALTQAFEAFNAISNELRVSYDALQQQVVVLNAELEQTRRDHKREAGNARRLAGSLDLLLETLPAGVVVVDDQGKIARTNPAAELILGGTHDDERWTDVARAVFERRLTTKGDWIRADGRLISTLTNTLDQPHQKIIVLTDVTETREIEDLVDRNERLSAMGRMAATLAHQIRTPLASALLYVSQLRKPTTEPDRVRIVDRAIEGMKKLDSLVQDMLVFARGAGPGARVRVADLFRDVDQSVRATMPSDAHLIIDGSDALLELEGNRTALAAALTNLVQNAVEAGPGIVVTMRAEIRGSRVRFSVEDNGPGIDPTLTSRVFEPFFSTRSAGTGLGLAVVKAVTEAHGGDLALESSSRTGTCFGLDLPRQADAEIADRCVA